MIQLPNYFSNDLNTINQCLFISSDAHPNTLMRMFIVINIDTGEEVFARDNQRAFSFRISYSLVVVIGKSLNHSHKNIAPSGL